MKKLFALLLSSILSFGALTSCGDNSFTPKNDLERVMLKLKDNNFSLDYYCSYLNTGNVEQNQKFYFTENAYQSDGYLGFGGVAYDNENVFKYTLDNGEVVSGQPLINNNSGMRYGNVYEHIQGMQDFDVSKLSYKDLGNNQYEYICGNDYNNDKIFLAVFIRYSILSSVMPEKIIMSVVKDTITFDCILMSYYLDDGTYVGRNDARATVYNVGTTHLDEIDNYLEDGKTSKKPLDNRIIRLINPYMHSNNYTVYLDSTGMSGQNFKAYEYFTDKAYYEVPDYDSANTAIGYIESQGAVHAYTINADEQVEIIGTPQADSDGNPYYNLYGDMFQYTFQSLYYANFIGYIDEEHPNSYIITDSQFVYTLAYLCYVEINEELYTDRARIEIVDEEKHEFNVYFDLINKATKQKLGTYKASFFDLNNTSIPAVDRYLNIGGSPKEQTKQDLQEVLTKFSEGNYSMDSLTHAGIAKNYFTSNYYFLELYQDKNNNVGFIKIDDKIHQFYIYDGVMNVNLSTTYNIQLPGCGTFMFSDDDLSYISHFDEQICNADNYEKAYASGIEFWKNTYPGFSQRMYNYIFNSASGAYPMGSGFTVSNSDNPYDTRVTLHSTYVLTDGSTYGSMSYTYYDIGNTSHPIIEAYLNNL